MFSNLFLLRVIPLVLSSYVILSLLVPNHVVLCNDLPCEVFLCRILLPFATAGA